MVERQAGTGRVDRIREGAEKKGGYSDGGQSRDGLLRRLG